MAARPASVDGMEALLKMLPADARLLNKLGTFVKENTMASARDIAVMKRVHPAFASGMSCMWKALLDMDIAPSGTP